MGASWPVSSKGKSAASLNGVILNYNTKSDARLFLSFSIKI
jgi:hypothetical protein